MKIATIAATLALALVPATLVFAQQEPGRLTRTSYDTVIAAGGHGSRSPYGHNPLANCQCDDRQGYDLWCQPVSFLDHFSFGRSHKGCCGSPAPSCCAPAPSCRAPEPICAPPEPTCCAPEPVCAAPAPACCAPEPTCTAPSACGCNKKCALGIFNKGASPLSDLHAKLKTLFACKKCCQSSCCCDGCGGQSPAYYQPSAPRTLPDLPETINNPFEDDPTNGIPVPNTTTRMNTRIHVKPVHIQF